MLMTATCIESGSDSLPRQRLSQVPSCEASFLPDNAHPQVPSCERLCPQVPRPQLPSCEASTLPLLALLGSPTARDLGRGSLLGHPQATFHSTDKDTGGSGCPLRTRSQTVGKKARRLCLLVLFPHSVRKAVEA